jgi:hypothetical protein
VLVAEEEDGFGCDRSPFYSGDGGQSRDPGWADGVASGAEAVPHDFGELYQCGGICAAARAVAILRGQTNGEEWTRSDSLSELGQFATFHTEDKGRINKRLEKRAAPGPPASEAITAAWNRP